MRKIRITKTHLKNIRRIVALVLIAALFGQTVSTRFFSTAYAAGTENNVTEGAATETTVSTELIDTNVPVTVVGEVESLRNEKEKHFRMSDGSFMAVSYGMAVHYEDENGEWQDIDNRMVLSEDQSQYLTENLQTATAFASKLNTGSLFETIVGDTSVGMALMDTSRANEIMSARQEELELAVIRGTQLSTSAIGRNVLGVLESGAAALESSSSAAIAAVQEELSRLKNLISQSALLNFDRTSVADTTVVVPNAVNTSLLPSGGEASASDSGTGWTMADILPENLQDAVLYEDVFPGVDLLYTKYSHNVKEQIIVKMPQTSYRYDFELTLDGVEAVLNEDGSVALVDEDGAAAYYIPAPFMEDTDGVISYDVEYILTPTETGAVLSVVADEEWMNDAERAYPVAIDPTLTVQTGEVKEDIHFAYTAQGFPDTFYGGATHSYIGYSGYNNIGECRGFLCVDDFPSIPEGMTMVDAAICLYMDEYSHVNLPQMGIGIYEVTDDKPDTITNYYYWVCRYTWNTMPAYDTTNMIDYTTVSASGVNQYYQWDVTELAKKWYAGEDVDRTIALTRVPGVNYTSNYAFVRFNAYYETNLPMFVVSYRDTRGIEPYYTYNTLGVGNAGTAYIADATGQLKVVKQVAYYASEINPFYLNLIYNSDYFAADASADYQPPARMTTESAINPDMLLGQGWTLDIIQTMTTVTIDGTEYICYHDGDGTKHYFLKDSDLNAAYAEENGVAKEFYYDEDGLGLKVEKTGTDAYIMYDEKDNSWTFTGGRLTEKSDESGNKYTINYTDNKITSIVQTNNGQTDITVATFTYSGDYLETIKDAADIVYGFTYTEGRLSGISRTETGIVSYGYAGNRLVEMKDLERLYSIGFEYDIGRVRSYQEFGGTIAGASERITYPNHSMTVYQSSGADRVFDTGDDLYTHYLFDYGGRTANAYTTDSEKNILGATNAVYTGTGATVSEGVDRTNNRTQRTASIGTASINLLDNGGFESTAGAWVIGNGSLAETKPRTGVYSLKGVLSGTDTVVSATKSVSLTAEKIYTFTAYVNTSEVTAFNGYGIYLEVKDSAGNVFSNTSYLYEEPVNYCTSALIDGGWIRMSLTFTAATTGSHTVGVYGTGLTGVFYVDDLMLEAGTAQGMYNLLENGSMDSSSLGWTLGNYGEYTAAGGWNNSGGIIISGFPSASANVYQDVPVNLPGTETYVLSGWANANAVPDNLNASGVDKEQDVLKQFGLRAVITYSGNETEYHYAPFNTELSGWQFVALTIVPKKPDKVVKTIRVMLAYEGNANEASFDYLSLVCEAAKTMEYDDDGNLTSVSTTGITKDTNTYEGGNLIEVITGGNGTYTFGYDETYEHRLTSVTDGVITQELGYDVTGNVSSTTIKSNTETNPLTINTSATYTNNGNLIFDVYDASGNNIHYAYGRTLNEAYGLPFIISSPNDVMTLMYYDDVGRLTKVDVDARAAVEYTYQNGNLTQILREVSPDVSQAYILTYDTFGNLTSLSIGEDNLATYTYGPGNGLLTNVSYANGSSVNYEYDLLGRLTKLTYSPNRTVELFYNSEGQLQSVDDSTTGKTYYLYDSLGRLIHSYQDFLNVRARYGYDDDNRLIRTDYNIQGWNDVYQTYTYNDDNTDNISDGVLTGMRMLSGDNVSLNYDYLQRLTYRTLAGQLREDYTYAAGEEANSTTLRVSEKKNTLAGTVKSRFQYTYDANGNILTSTDTVSGKSVTYTYDYNNQLTGAVYSDGRTEAYTYDKSGNILTSSDGTSSHVYTYGDSNWKDLLTAVDGTELSYDENGNPTSYYNGRTYSMSWYNTGDMYYIGVDNQYTLYMYNPDGLRTFKSYGFSDAVEYIVSDGKTIGETYHDDELNEITRYMRYIFDENDTVCGYSLSTDGTTWVTYYFIKNLQGDVLQVYRASDNVIVAEYTYDSWGKILSATGEQAEINPFRYRSYYYDEESDLYYLNSRYYDPEIGRFISADDVSYLGYDGTTLSYNLYAYCKNNPVNYMDKEGAFAISTAIIVAGVTSAVISAFDMAICASMSGQDFWKGFLAGFVGGVVGFAVGQWNPLAGRAVGTALTSIVNDMIQNNGSFDDVNWVALATDVVMDVAYSMLYVDAVASLGNNLGNEILEKTVQSAVGGAIDAGVDIAETYLIYNSQKKHTGSTRSLGGGGGKALVMAHLY